MNKTFSEAPSLTMLYGADIEREIFKAARKYNVRPDAVANMIESNPALMGESKFLESFQTIAKSVGDAAPGIGQAINAIRSGKAITPAVQPAAPAMQTINTPFGPVSPLMLALPVAGILGFMLIKQMKKADKKRR